MKSGGGSHERCLGPVPAAREELQEWAQIQQEWS